MKLQEQMDAVKASFVGQAPGQTLNTMERAAEKLRDSGIIEQTVKVGDEAPAFSLRSTSTTEVHLRSLLAKGPVVLCFFRGSW